jgi:ketosteroid isomerase-like protein
MNLTPIELVRTFFNSLAPGRRQILMELLDPAVVLEIQEGFPGTRPRYTGIRAYLGDFLFALFGSFELQLIPEEFLESGTRVVTLGRQKGRAVLTGVPIDVPFVGIWTIEDGRIVNVRLFTDTAIFRDAIAGLPATEVEKPNIASRS